MNVFLVKEVFRFVTDPNINGDDQEEIDGMLGMMMEESFEKKDTEGDINDFLNMNIPRSLKDFNQYEVEEILERFRGSIEAILYANQTGLINDEVGSEE